MKCSDDPQSKAVDPKSLDAILIIVGPLLVAFRTWAVIVKAKLKETSVPLVK
jgi:hypothetical protein